MFEKFNPVTLHETVAAATRLEGNGSAVNVDGAHDIYVVAEINKGGATAIVLTPERNDAVPTAWVGLANNMRMSVAVDTGTSDTQVRQADGVAYTSGAVATTHRVVMKINPDSLGLQPASDEPITQIRVAITGGDANDRGSVTAYLVPRYK